jgi:hypothetical protein
MSVSHRHRLSVLHQAAVRYTATIGGYMPKFLVKGVRRSVGENTTEGSFDSLDAAVARIQELKGDEDCLLAEAEEWPSLAESFAGRQHHSVKVKAQAERDTGWAIGFDDDMRRRSRGVEARELLLK